MNWKKIIAGCTAGVLAVVSLVSCNGGGKGNKPVTAADGPFGKYEPMLTLNVARSLGTDVKFAEGESLENNVWANLYRDELGIDLKYAWTAPEQQYNQKVSLVIASGDLPDMMPVELKDVYKLAEAGLIEDLTDAFEQYASPLVKEFAEQNKNSMDLATYNKKLMAIPSMGGDPISDTNVLYIRKDWLDNLGLEAPTNMEEFLKVAYAFAKNDPDKNGKDDTYGFSMSKEIAAQGINDTRGLFNGYGAYIDIWLDKDGTLEYGSIQPEVKTALATLQKLYADGIVDPEFMIKERFKTAEDITAGKVGMFYGVGWAGIWCGNNMAAQDGAQWISVPAVSATGNKTRAQTRDAGATKYFVVKKGVKNKEALVKLLNLGTEMLKGERFNRETYDKYEIIPQENGENLQGDKYIYIIAGGNNTQPNHWKNVSEAFDNDMEGVTDPRIVIDVQQAYKYTRDHDKNFASSWFLWVSKDSPFSVIKQYIDEDRVQFDKFFGYPTETMTTSQSILDQKQLEMFTKIISGESLDLFDDYVQQWHALGGDKIKKEVNEWYHSYLEDHKDGN